jgi:hypothetical protein
MEGILHWKQGRSWAMSNTPNLSGVEQKNEQKSLYLKM